MILTYVEGQFPRVAPYPNSQPDPETLQAVEGHTLLRMDRNGWIHLSTDGEQMWVEVERK